MALSLFEIFIPMDRNYQYIFKIILIGDSGVGKTSLMTRFTDKCYEESSLTTIGVDFKIKTIDIDGAKVKLQIWDTAGQEKFRAIVSNYYRGAQGILLVFDMLNRKSFTSLSDWLGELEKKGALNTADIMILGNKIDSKEQIDVFDEEIQSFLSRNNIPESCFIKVSAKDDVGVEESFMKMAKRLVEKDNVSFKGNKKSKIILKNTNMSNRCC